MSSTTPQAPEPHAPQPHEPAWRPRVAQDQEHNAFSNDHRSPDIIAPPERIRDPNEDTAPLQGERDRSDDDSVVPDEPTGL